MMRFICFFLTVPLLAAMNPSGVNSRVGDVESRFPYVPTPGGSYESALLLHNDTGNTANYQIEAFGTGGDSLGVVQGSIAAITTTPISISDLYPDGAASLRVSAPAGVTALLEINAVGELGYSQIEPTTASASTWKMFAHNPDQHIDAIAATNTSPFTVDLTLFIFRPDGSQAGSELVFESLPPNGSARLVITPDKPVEDAIYVIEATGDIDLQGLVIPNASGITAAVRAFPRGPGILAANGFIPQLFADGINRFMVEPLSTGDQDFTLFGFADSDFVTMGFNGVVPSGSHYFQTGAVMFPEIPLAYGIALEGDVSVGVHYETADGTTGWAYETDTFERKWMFYPGEAPTTRDFIAVVNTWPSDMNVRVRARDINGQLLPDEEHFTVPPAGQVYHQLTLERQPGVIIEVLTSDLAYVSVLRDYPLGQLIFEVPTIPIHPCDGYFGPVDITEHWLDDVDMLTLTGYINNCR